MTMTIPYFAGRAFQFGPTFVIRGDPDYRTLKTGTLAWSYLDGEPHDGDIRSLGLHEGREQGFEWPKECNEIGPVHLELGHRLWICHARRMGKTSGQQNKV